MQHEDIEVLIPAYAVGATDPDEKADVERHLPDCQSCQAMLAEYRALCAEMLLAVPPVAAPVHLNADLAQRLGQARNVPARRQVAGSRRSNVPRNAAGRPAFGLWRWPAPALGGLALAIVLLLATNLFWWQQSRRLQADLTARATAVAMLARHPADVPLQPEASVRGASGSFYFDPNDRLGVLRVAGLPPVPPGRTYQVWLIHGTQRQSGALFRVEATGETLVLINAPGPLRQFEGLGVTLEPAGGSPGPTSPRLIGGKF